MTKDEAERVLRILRAAWPNVALLPGTFQVWWESALSDCDFELGQRIALDLCATVKEFPSPAIFKGRRRELARAELQLVTTKEPEEIPQLPNEDAQAYFDAWKRGEVLEESELPSKRKS